MNPEIETFIRNKLESGEYLLIQNYLGKFIISLGDRQNYEDLEIIEILQEREYIWAELESSLEKYATILRMTKEDLVKYFHGRQDELVNEPGKFFDLLNELHTTEVLNSQGFKKITRIYPPNKQGQKEADFVAWHGREKFAIEVKTIRPSKKEEEARIAPGLAYNVGILEEMLQRKVIDKLLEACGQLKATAKRRNCNKTLLAIWVMRNAAVVKIDDFGEIHKNIKQDYPDIDYFVFNGYWHPKLKQIIGSVPITNRNSGIFSG